MDSDLSAEDHGLTILDFNYYEVHSGPLLFPFEPIKVFCFHDVSMRLVQVTAIDADNVASVSKSEEYLEQAYGISLVRGSSDFGLLVDSDDENLYGMTLLVTLETYSVQEPSWNNQVQLRFGYQRPPCQVASSEILNEVGRLSISIEATKNLEEKTLDVSEMI